MDQNKMSQEKLYAQAQKSGLTYNEAKQYITKTTGGRDTKRYSDTDIESVRQENLRVRNRQLNDNK